MNQLFQSFGIDGRILFWQIVNFGLLFLILTRFFYKPVKRMMRERTDKARESLERADALEAKTKEMEAKLVLSLAAQRAEIETMHKRAETEHAKLRTSLRAEAEAEAKKIIVEARALAAEEKEALLRSAEQEIKGLAVALAGKIIEHEIDARAEKKLIDEALKALQKA